MNTNIYKSGGDVAIQEGSRNAKFFNRTAIGERYFDDNDNYIINVRKADGSIIPYKIPLAKLRVEGDAVADVEEAETALEAVFPDPAGTGLSSSETSQEFTGSTNLTLTLAHAYVSGSIKLYKNNTRLNAASFTQATATTITLNVARLADDEFIVDYKY